MFSPSQMSLLTIHADESDRLADLAQLDSAAPLTGTAVVAEVDGTAVAALEIETGRAVADPFRPTAKIVDMLRIRAAQLR